MIELNNMYTAGNEQWIINALNKLPVKSAIGNGHSTIEIVTTRPLTASEAFLPGTCGSELKEITDDQTFFCFVV